MVIVGIESLRRTPVGEYPGLARYSTNRNLLITQRGIWGGRIIINKIDNYRLGPSAIDYYRFPYNPTSQDYESTTSRVLMPAIEISFADLGFCAANHLWVVGSL